MGTTPATVRTTITDERPVRSGALMKMQNSRRRERKMMDTQGMLDGGMWGMGLVGLLVLVLIVLGIAALVKYLRQ